MNAAKPVRVLAVDDQIGLYEGPLRAAMSRALSDGSIELKTSDRAAAALESASEIDVLVLDLEYPKQEQEVARVLGTGKLRRAEVGLAILSHFKKNCPDVLVIVVTQNTQFSVLNEVNALGPFDEVDKAEGYPEGALVEALFRAARMLRAPATAAAVDLEVPEWPVTASPNIRAAFRDAFEIAGSGYTVLLLGEPGVGKEVFARSIHEKSPRKDGPFVALNVAAMADTLIEGELFGWEKGAHDKAFAKRDGLVQEADGGTLFLDEIGEASPSLQKKLLRLLQEGEFYRLGAQKPTRVDVRVIAATNRDLEEAKAEGTFRKDLHYRLSRFVIAIPPLRERRADVRPLVATFLAKFNAELGKSVRITRGALERLERHTWPGNVRELENCICAAVVKARGPVIDEIPLPAAGDGTSLVDRFRSIVRELADAIAGPAPHDNQIARRLVEDIEMLLWENLYARRGSWSGVGECFGKDGHAIESSVNRKVSNMAQMILDGERRLEDVPAFIHARVAKAVARARSNESRAANRARTAGGPANDGGASELGA